MRSAFGTVLETVMYPVMMVMISELFGILR